MPTINGVAGTLAHGQSVTISGSDFGTKTHAGPMVWDHFDDAGSGDLDGRTPTIHQGNLSSYSAWDGNIVGSGGSGPQRNASSLKARSTFHARMSFLISTGTHWASRFSIPYNDFTTGNELYISFYYRFTKTAANFGRQTKAWVVYNSSVNDKAYWSNAFGTCQSPNAWFTHRTEDGDQITMTPGLASQASDAEWQRHESYLKQSSAGGTDGTWHQVVYRPTLGTPSKHVVTLDNYKMRDTSSEWVDWTFGGAYYDQCDVGDTCTIDLDEFVMDSQRARVELANTSTWAARTFSEYQRATSWADGSITVELNAGHFGDSATAWLYVHKTDGSVNSNGFEITLGDEGGGGGGGAQTLLRPAMAM